MPQSNTSSLYRQWQFISQCRNGDDKKSRWLSSISLILAVAIHLLVIVQFTSLTMPKMVTSPQEIFLEVEWVSPVVADEVPQERPAETAIPIPPVVPQIIPPKPKPKIKIKNIQPKKTTPPVIPKAVPTQPIIHHTNSIKATPMPAIVSKIFSQKKALYTKMRQDYLSHIIAIINTHKSYPYAARRRHIEGDVHITFSIANDGQIRGLQLTGKKASLRHASIEALEASKPLPKPPESLSRPIQANFIMQYRLKR